MNKLLEDVMLFLEKITPEETWQSTSHFVDSTFIREISRRNGVMIVYVGNLRLVFRLSIGRSKTVRRVFVDFQAKFVP